MRALSLRSLSGVNGFSKSYKISCFFCCIHPCILYNWWRIRSCFIKCFCMRCKYAICIHVTAQKFFPEIFRTAKNQICIFFKSADKILYFLRIIRICIFYFPTIYNLTILTSGTDNSIFSKGSNRPNLFFIFILLYRSTLCTCICL